MSKFTKRLLCALAAVIAIVALSLIVFAEQGQQVQGPECYEHGDVNGDGVITNKDAIYILYRYMFEDDQMFPINQIWDYNEDGNQDNKDAIYVLYHYMFEGDDTFKLKGTIHDYYDPSWAWNDETGTAQVTFKCGCGQPKVYTTENGVTVTAGQKVAATCVKAGSQVYTASVTVDGEEYTNTYTKTLPAGEGHKMVGTQDCENGSHCENCDYSVAALGHSWKLETTAQATCTVDAYELYRCSGCQATDKKVLEGTAGHSMQYDKDVSDGCKVTRWYKCAVSGCGHTAAGTATSDVYYEHSYTATLTPDATCVSEGVKTYTCSVCAHSYWETVAKNDAHLWEEGVTAGNVTTYSCSRSGCQATKTAVAAQDTAVSNDALKNNELQLKDNASMKLDDQAVAGLDQNKAVKVSVEVVDPEEAGLTAQQQAQVGDAKVYDFSMKYEDGSAVSQFEGEVTICLPYKLEEGEDVDSINVWYIDDSGNPTAVKATYSNGFVTFTTTHFSYYTVTRLTPAERCALYGHAKVSRSKTVTCTEDGYEAELCSRCGHVFKNEVKAHSGHDFTKNVTKAATCEATGAFVESCGNCKAQITGVIPATGHTMALDSDKSVAATCEQAGKDVYVCANDGCSHEREDAKAQLSHDYKAYESTEPDCENKGIETKKCQLCNDVVTVEEKLPLGHSFETKNATWSWSNDHLSATVTLTCSHDKAHTKVLTAVVSKVVSGGTCETGAGVTYTATVSHNKETFTDTYSETQAAPGHTAGTQWQSNANQHYHICDVCQEPVDKAAHTWNEGTVTKEATCAEAGKAVYACLVCGYEQEKTVPATKQHNYVNGICSVCGHDENACNHYKVTETELDLSGYNICEGAWATRYSCECGENTYYDYNLLCNMDYDVEPEKIVENGITYYVYTYACVDCGLVQKAVEGAEDLTDECVRVHCVDVSLIFDGQQIMQTRHKMGEQTHPPKILVEAVDLTGEAYGLCTEQIEIYKCGCEEALLEVVTVEHCDWEQTGQDQETGAWIYECNDCGAVKHNGYKNLTVEGSCKEESQYTYTYYVDGKQVYTLTETDEYYYHDYEAVDYELFGESCEDGALVQLACSRCDATDEFYTVYHEPVVSETVDLPNTCIGKIRTYRCACGEYQGFAYNGEDYCSWGEPVTNADGSSSVTCQECGVTETYKSSSTEGDNCVVTYEATCTYQDAQGNVIAKLTRCSTEIHHDNEITDVIFNGQSCEDGIQLVQTCQKCGYTYRESYGYHRQFEKDRIDLSEYGLCQEYATVNACLCGENADISWSGQSCQWIPVAGEGGINYEMTIYRCDVCGGSYKYERTEKATEDPCRMATVITYTFYQSVEAEEAIDSLEIKRVSYSHDMRASFTLNNAELGCEGGYKVTETCERCGTIEEYNYGTGAGHYQFMVDRQKLSDGQLCGDVYQQFYRCPCGQRTEKEISFENGHCDWQWTSNGYRCSVCGVSYEEEYNGQQVEGTTCQYETGWTYTYSKDGQELFTAVESWISYDHRSVKTYQMNGTTCDEGYWVTGTCLDCGAVTDDYYNWCAGLAVERTQIVDDENMCGPVDWVHYQCPCGEIDNWSLDVDCNWNWVGSNQNGDEMWTCRDCGAKWVRNSEQERIDGTCKYQVTCNDTFTVGEQTYSCEKTYEKVEHQTIAVLTCLGDSCEDGYQRRWKCRYCDYMEEGYGEGNSHSKYTVEYYDLADYGMCGGYVSHSSCACGLESSWGWSLGACDGRGTGTTDPDTGDTLYYCQNCQSYYSWGEDGEQDTENCIFTGSFYFKLAKGEETLLNLRGATSRENHNSSAISTTLMDPNGTCEDGVVATWQCADCLDTWTSTSYNHGYYMPTEKIETSCGGYFEFRQCPCGEWNDVSYYCKNMTGESLPDTEVDGVVHSFWKNECRTCGLYILLERYETDLEGCQAQVNHIYTVRYGDQEKVVAYAQTVDSHNFGREHYELMPNAKTCEDGVLMTRTCADCGEVESWTSSNHGRNLKESIDLTAYGSVCGGTLDLYACACGEYQEYRFSDELQCDLDQQGIGCWIEGALNEHQSHIEYNGSTYSYGYLIRCAVTDPESCGLTIRMADYWMREDDCTAVRYHKWQLGYDETTGTCQKEITIATGERKSFHDFEETDLYQKAEDGSYVNGRLYTCSDCGSTYHYQNDFDANGNHLRYEEIFVSTLDNGEYKRRSEQSIYEDVGGAYACVQERYECTYADGSEYWNQSVYTYDLANCTRTSVWTNSDGRSETASGTYHVSTTYHYDSKQSTCSQPGYYHWWYTCDICGEIDYEYTQVYQPGHDWYWNGETYVCSTCGLQGENGADGDIILEDLTETYGNGTDYVIGYYNPKDINVELNLSVILDNAEGDNQISLDFDDFTYVNDSYQGVTFNKEAADAAAAAAVPADYEGTYAIRISFVPTGASSTLDYAITFDSVQAQ